MGVSNAAPSVITGFVCYMMLLPKVCESFSGENSGGAGRGRGGAAADGCDAFHVPAQHGVSA